MYDFDALAACRYIKRGLFAGVHYPAFSRQYVRTKIDQPGTEPLELADYRANLVDSGRWQAMALVLLYIMYCSKCLYSVYDSLQLYDHSNLLKNVRPAAINQERLASMNYTLPSQSLRLLSKCLITNCTSLTNRQPSGSSLGALAEDVGRLPLPVMCSPNLYRFYPVAPALDTFGVLVMLVSVYTISLLGYWPLVQQMLWPAGSDMIMFLTSPKITIKVARQRASELLHDLNVSYHNYSDPIELHRKHKHQRNKPEQRREFVYHQHQRGVGPSRALIEALDDKCVILSTRQRDEPNLLLSRDGQLNGARQPTTHLFYFDRRDLVSDGALSDWDSPWEDDGRPMQAKRRPSTSREAPNAPPSSRLDGRRTSSANRPTGRRSRAESNSVDGVDSPPTTTHIGERAIDNCMPLVRTEWWRPWLARVLVRTMIYGVVIISNVSLWSFAYIYYKTLLKNDFLHEVQAWTRRSNCFVWPHYSADSRTGGGANSLDAGRAFHFDQMDIHYGPWSFLETLLFNYMPGFTIAFMFTYYWAGVTELGLWLAEMRMAIVASVLVTQLDWRQQTARNHERKCQRCKQLEAAAAPGATTGSQRKQPRGYLALNTRSFYTVPNLRRRVQQSTTMFLIFVLTRLQPTHSSSSSSSSSSPSSDDQTRKGSSFFQYHLLGAKQNDRYYKKQFLREIISPIHYDDNGMATSSHDEFAAAAAAATTGQNQPERAEYDIETMEQIYVNFRLLVEYAHSLGPSMALILAITYLLNYGYLFIAVTCHLKFPDFIEEALAITVFGFFIANYLIFMAADFHANAKKLQPLLWSLVANLTHAKSLRAQHLRSLWLKQAIKIDQEGGLALNALGARITYVYIIQMTIWTATILALAMKPRN